MVRIGLRELRQHASRYVDYAARGETVEVTRRGEVVAVLRRPEPGTDEREDLIRAGVIVPGGGDWLDIEPIAEGLNISVELEALREETR